MSRLGLCAARRQGQATHYETTLELPCGAYACKLRVDGQWMLDPDNPRTRSIHGQRNHAISVGGAPEPLLFAPALPFVYVDESGLAVVSTVFVDRFRPQNDAPAWGRGVQRDEPAGGHLDGIRRSLQGLAELGVTVSYLTPVHVAAHCHRYDLVDPMRVDPELGGEPALVRLLECAHQMGLRSTGRAWEWMGSGSMPLRRCRSIWRGRSAAGCCATTRKRWWSERQCKRLAAIDARAGDGSTPCVCALEL